MKIKSLAWVIIGISLPLGGFAAGERGDMADALKDLQKAKENLEQASADKGGHRVKAIKLIQQAISEIHAGIQYDRDHLSKGEKGEKDDHPMARLLKEKENH